VFVTRRFTIAVTICRDIMAATVRRQLEDLGVTLLIVPAMTPKTRTLVDNACELVATNQAFVVVAKAPALWRSETPHQDRAQAAFHAAYGTPGGPREVPPNAEALTEPGIVVFDAYERTVVALPGDLGMGYDFRNS